MSAHGSVHQKHNRLQATQKLLQQICFPLFPFLWRQKSNFLWWRCQLTPTLGTSSTNSSGLGTLHFALPKSRSTAAPCLVAQDDLNHVKQACDRSFVHPEARPLLASSFEMSFGVPKWEKWTNPQAQLLSLTGPHLQVLLFNLYTPCIWQRRTSNNATCLPQQLHQLKHGSWLIPWAEQTQQWLVEKVKAKQRWVNPKFPLPAPFFLCSRERFPITTASSFFSKKEYFHQILGILQKQCQNIFQHSSTPVCNNKFEP